MAEATHSPLPTDLYDDKTFYTLGGAGGAVVLVCWAVNYAFPDLSYKVFRAGGFLLSIVFAFLIMKKNKSKTSDKWLFMVLNAALIFVNSSGINVMTASYANNAPAKADSIVKPDTTISLWNSHEVNPAFHAGIFALPKMVSWWPDVELVEENMILKQTNEMLARENLALSQNNDLDHQSGTMPCSADSLEKVISALRSDLDDFIANKGSENNIIRMLRDSLLHCDELNSGLQSGLKTCEDHAGELNSNLDLCRNERNAYNDNINSLKNQLEACNESLKVYKNNTLTQHIEDACTVKIKTMYMNGQPSPDSQLMSQDFWRRFCDEYSGWKYPVK